MSDQATVEHFLDWCAKRGIRLTQSDPDQNFKRVLVPRGKLIEEYRLDGGFGR